MSWVCGHPCHQRKPYVPYVVGVVAHTAKEDTLRAVGRGCVVTHTAKEKALRCVRRGCVVTHTVREETLRSVRRG